MKKSLMAIPSLLVAGLTALPILTCPACWPLYAGLLSSMGLGFSNYTPYLLPVTAVLLGLSLFSFIWKAEERRGYLPLALGIIAALLILSGKFYFEQSLMVYGGVSLLIAASIWNIWPKKGTCHHCVD